MMRRDTFGMLEPETRLLLNSLLTEPSKSHTQLIDDTIYQLKQAGIWSKLDCLYLLAAPSTGFAAVNWINLASTTSPPSTARRLPPIRATAGVDAVTRRICKLDSTLWRWRHR